MTKAALIRTTFNWGRLTGSEIQSIVIKAGTQQHPGRHDAGGAKSFKSSSEDCKQNTDFQAVTIRVLKSRVTVTFLLQQGHTYSNKAIPSNCATPWGENIQIITIIEFVIVMTVK